MHSMPHGQFLGNYSRRRDAPGLSLAELVPTVPAAQVRTHTHEDAHFVLLMSGGYISTAAGVAEGPAGPPLLIYNPPGTTHRDRFYELDGRFFTISVAAERLRHAAEYVPLPDRATAFVNGPALALAQRLMRECRRWSAASPLVAEGLSLELLSETTRHRERRHRRPPRWLETARELLDARSPAGIRIAAVAASVHVHPVHLTRTFREFYGATPGEYLRRCRLDRAAGWLTAAQMPLAEIALESGFADQSSFAKAFQKRFGMSPGGYRRLRPRKMFVSGQSVPSAQEPAARS